MSNIQVNREGTAYVQHQDGSLLYQCQYCQQWFEPKIRYKQKFCSESCRTMACRERMHGLAGTLQGKRQATSNADLLRQLQVIERRTASSIEQTYGRLLDRQRDTEIKLREEILKLNTTISSMGNKLDILMFISAIAPVVSPAIVSWFKEVAMGEKPPTDNIKEELAAIRDRLDETTRLQLKKMLEEQKLQDIAELLG